MPEDKVRQLIGTVDPHRSLAAQRAYLVAFFGQHLRGVPTELFAADSPVHPDVHVIH